MLERGHRPRDGAVPSGHGCGQVFGTPTATTAAAAATTTTATGSTGSAIAEYRACFEGGRRFQCNTCRRTQDLLQ